MEEQVAVIWAATNGYLDDVPAEDVPRFDEELQTMLKGEGKVLPAISEKGELSDETTEALKAIVEKFKQSFYVEEEGAAA
jgi:F-type H+-transporting ATPase subunit alpha